MKKKFLALGLAVAMAVSMTACGASDSPATVTATPTPGAPVQVTATPTAAPIVAEPTVAPVKEASVNFEDGNIGFANVYMQHALAGETELSLGTFNNSKALKVQKTNANKNAFVGIDVYGLLGDKAADVAKVEMSVGLEYPDGSFNACSGKVYFWTGTKTSDMSNVEWSVYVANKNPKVCTFALPEDYKFSAENSALLFQLNTDNGAADHGGATVYIDDIRFLDANGNVVKADTTVAFTAPAGFESNGKDLTNLAAISDEVDFPGFATKGSAWGQDGFEIPEDVLNAMVPGSVVEIEYASKDGSLWIVLPDAKAGWSRVADGGKSYINNSKSTCQITYEQIVAVVGENKDEWGSGESRRLQCESSSEWEVFSVKVGKANERAEVVGGVDFPGFATKGAAWGQDGFEMPEEILNALVPGSAVELSYASEDDSLWIVFPDAKVGWSRIAQDTAILKDGTCIVSYDQIISVVGENKDDWGSGEMRRMQAEAKTNWEVYGAKVGTFVKFPRLNQFTDFEGFATKGNAWGQDGFDIPANVLDAMGPGSVLEINYTSEDGSMWVVFPDAKAGWSRVADGGKSICSDGICYVTYEQIVAVVGENKEDWGARLQCEASSNWEVYSVRVGQGLAAASEGSKNPEEDPRINTLSGGTVANKGSKTFSDAAWWTQVDVTRDDILGSVNPEEVTAIRFYSDTDFIVGYNAFGSWKQYDKSNEYIVGYVDLDDTFGMCLFLSKGDGVEYTINWEVYTGAEVVRPEPEPAVDPTNDTIEGTVAGTGTKTVSDSAWWTEFEVSLDEMLCGVAADKVIGIKFTGDTTFVIGYNGDATDTSWQQFSDKDSYVVKHIALDDTYAFKFFLSKGDGVEYHLTWEVYTE